MNRDLLGRIRQSSLSLDQVNLLRVFVQAGGEAPIYVDRLRPETRDRKIAKINSLIARDYVEIDLLRSSGHRWLLRLTDEGRSLWSGVTGHAPSAPDRLAIITLVAEQIAAGSP